MLALGGLGFGVSAQLRANDLESKVGQLERSAATSPAPIATTSRESQAAQTSLAPATQPPPTDARTQPDDLAGARQSVVNAFETVYNGSLPIQTRLDLVDDATGISDLLTFRAGSPGGDVLVQIRGRVENVSFTSGSKATVQYSITVPGSSPYTGRIGEAKLVGNTWKVTRAAVCNDLQGLLQLSCP